jgi:EmrB/QacA subfamily drug resistance transporter
VSQIPGSPAYGLATSDPPRDRSGPWPTFWLAVLGTFLAYLDVTIVNIAFPDIAGDFDGSGLGALSWVVNAYALAFAALLVVLGRAADRIGRRRIYLGGVALFAVASAGCAVAASPGLLIAARTVQGVAAAAMIPAALALLLAAFPPQKWPAAIAAWGAVSAVAAALGPPLGGLLVEAGSWRWIFVINVPVGLVTVWLGSRRLRESRAVETAPPDLPGAVLLAGATAALALALVQGETWGWSSAATVGTFAAALGIGGLLVARTRRIAAPVLEPALLRTRWVRAANAGTMAFGAALFAANLCLVLFATSVWGWTALETGIAAVPGALASAVSAPLGGRWATRSGPRPVAAVGAALFAAALAWMLAMAGEDPNFLGVWLPYQLAAGVGIGLGLPTLIGATASGLPPARFATGMALATTARQLGAVLGVALLVAVIGTPAPGDAMAAFDAGFALCAIAVTLAAGAALLLGPRPEPVGAVARAVRTASSSA